MSNELKKLIQEIQKLEHEVYISELQIQSELLIKLKESGLMQNFAQVQNTKKTDEE